VRDTKCCLSAPDLQWRQLAERYAIHHTGPGRDRLVVCVLYGLHSSGAEPESTYGTYYYIKMADNKMIALLIQHQPASSKLSYTSSSLQ
jgi:hypothetical protein